MLNNSQPPATLPLSSLLVLDLTIARAGPTCVRHLADWGADVILIEPPNIAGEDVVGSRSGPDFQNLHRNKRTLSLNLKSPEGHAIFMQLVKRADVIVENMRPAVKHRLKISWDDVKKVNPRLVYGSVSGFGQDGPHSGRVGVDQILQGVGGLMSVTGNAGQGPMRVGIAINDLVSGTLLAFGIMTALFDMARTGVGRWVHTSLLEAQVFMMDFQAARYLMKGEIAGQTGNDHPTLTPSSVFPTSDGQINIAATSSRLWGRFCDTIGKPEWKTKVEWSAQSGRSKNREAINAAISDVTRQRPSAYWLEVFDTAGIPCGPIHTMDQVFADPQVQHLGIAAPVKSPVYGDTHVVGSAINIEGVPKAIRTPTPDAGAHTEEILRWLGYTDEETGSLRAKGVI